MAGDLAVNYSEFAGLKLDPWQEHVVRNGLGQVDGKWVAREVACQVPRQNGKGAIIIARELAGLFVFKEELIIHTAQRGVTLKAHLDKIAKYIESSPELNKQVKQIYRGNEQQGVWMRDGRKLQFILRSRDQARGLTANCIIIDEAYDLTTEEQSALNFTVSAVPNAQIWYLSTPPLDPISSAPLYKLRERARNGSSRLAFFDWGAPESINFDDPREWAASNPALGIRIELETVTAERESMPEVSFGRERLGIWPEKVANHVVSPEVWAKLGDPDSVRGDQVAFAVDISHDRGSACIAACGLRSDGRIHLEVVDYRPGTNWLVPRLVELRERYNSVGFGLDVSGPAATLLLDLAKAGFDKPDDEQHPKPGQLALASTQDKVRACGQLLDAVNQATLRHKAQPTLDMAVMGAKTASMGDAITFTRKSSTVDISPLYAVTLARWTYETRAHLVNQAIEPRIFFF